MSAEYGTQIDHRPELKALGFSMSVYRTAPDDPQKPGEVVRVKLDHPTFFKRAALGSQKYILEFENEKEASAWCDGFIHAIKVMTPEVTP